MVPSARESTRRVAVSLLRIRSFLRNDRPLRRGGVPANQNCRGVSATPSTSVGPKWSVAVRLEADAEIRVAARRSAQAHAPNGQPMDSHQDFCLGADFVNDSCPANQRPERLKRLV